MVLLKAAAFPNLYWEMASLLLEIIPFIIVFYVAVTNSVNLTDGLDGLAGGVSTIYLIAFGVIMAILGFGNLGIISFAMAGALIGFLLFNGFPAKIFMGDGGSQFLGFMIATVPLYVSGEESAEQIKSRADRLNINKDNLIDFKEEMQKKYKTNTINIKITILNNFIDYLGLPKEYKLKHLKQQYKNTLEEVITASDYERLLRIAKARGKTTK